MYILYVKVHTTIDMYNQFLLFINKYIYKYTYNLRYVQSIFSCFDTVLIIIFGKIDECLDIDIGVSC